MILEGLVFHRIPYKERDLIVKILLRNGLAAGFYVYGGQGGGKKKNPSFFEVGSMMKINIKESKNQHADLLIPKEYDRLWGPQHIRYDIKAYYLMTLYFELIQKIAMPFNLGEKDLDQAGNFSVLSNALFYMDESVQKKNFLPEQHLILFLVKFLYHLGIMPDTQSCGYCRTPLQEGKGVFFLPEQGQFSCRECYPGESSADDLELMKNVLLSYQTKYSEYADLKTYKFRDCDKLLLYFCQQFQLKPLELKSYKLLFS